jgi:hypothetical protein
MASITGIREVTCSDLEERARRAQLSARAREQVEEDLFLVSESHVLVDVSLPSLCLPFSKEVREAFFRACFLRTSRRAGEGVHEGTIRRILECQRAGRATEFTVNGSVAWRLQYACDPRGAPSTPQPQRPPPRPPPERRR